VSDELSAKGWNVSDLARQAGIDLGTAGDFLNGARWPQRTTQGRIETALGIKTGTLSRIEQEMPAGDEDPGTVSAEEHTAGVLLDIDPEIYANMDPISRKRAKAESEALYYRIAEEARRRADER
jgi:transcriptional regulator with XRE-family HTH domain